MRKDTRANLIFLTLFLLLALPGIFKLTRDAYKTGGRDPAMRPVVRGQWAYMDPTPQVRDLPRVVPPGIARFVSRFAERLERMQPGLKSIVTETSTQAVMSDALSLQVIGLGASQDDAGGKFHVGLFAWNSKYAPLPSQYTITGHRGAETVSGQMTGYEPVNLPVELRVELQDYGYIMPPDSLLWVIVSFPGAAPLDSITVHYTLDKVTIDDQLVLPHSLTSPATRPAP